MLKVANQFNKNKLWVYCFWLKKKKGEENLEIRVVEFLSLQLLNMI
jgi:hypothetical protein